MYLIFTASQDNYITNKIISDNLSASHANVGQASTLDLFKIYNETAFSGYTGSFAAPTEISRLLVKFDLSEISSSIRNFAELNGFSCYLNLKDINGSLLAPSKFNVIVYPLSQSWDEGRGKDIYAFNDLDRSNWVTASYTGGADIPWNGQGARAEGYLNSSDIDVIGSGTIGDEVKTLYTTQYFSKGHENLFVDVTTAVSGVMAGFLPDHGFCIAFSGSEETDTKTRFVKRFASRHARNPYLRPSLVITYNDSRIDDRANMVFNRTGSLFLENFAFGSPANLISGSAATQMTGSDVLKVIFHSGSWAVTSSGGQYAPAGKSLPGVYSASVSIDEFSNTTLSGSYTLAEWVASNGALKVHEKWMDSQQKVTFYTGSFFVNQDSRFSAGTKQNYSITIQNLAQSYRVDETHSVKLFARDKNKIMPSIRKNYGLKSIVFANAYYQIRDVSTGQIFIPFQTSGNSTRISSDGKEMYFDFSTRGLAVGRSYTFDILVILGNNRNVYKTKSIFRVDK